MTAEAAPLGAGNPRLKRLRRLARRRREREEAGLYVVEGPTLVSEAVDSGADIREVYVGEDVVDGHRWLLDAPDPVEVHRVREGVLERVLDPVTPRPVAAVVAVNVTDLADVLETAAAPALLLLLAGVGDPGNAGTLIRTAEATGAAAVVFAEDSVDPYSPKTVRASAGAVFRVPTVGADAVGALRVSSAAGLRSWAATQDDGLSVDEVDLSGPTVLVVGSESHGVPAGLLAAVDGRVSIPMAGGVESLNAAMAGTVLAFEAARQRRLGR